MSGESAAAVLLWASACLLQQQSSRTPDWKQQVLICPTGFDFGSCPGWSACQHHPVYSLWRHASQNVSLRLFFALQSETWLRVDHPPSVCRNGLRERHRAAERVRGRGLQQEQVSGAEPPDAAGWGFTWFCSNPSMFGSVELDSLDPCRVNYVNIRVVSDQEGVFT